MRFEIRKYEPEDRDQVRWICCETGFMGEPVEAYFFGREIFADVWTQYWTDFEPESCFVAEVDGKVIGYLLGCLDTARQERIFQTQIMLKIQLKALTSSFFFHKKNWRFFFQVYRSYRRGEFNEPKNQLYSDYPAHLHTNIAPEEFRGKGIGKALLLAYLEYLKAHKSKGVHLVTTSRNRLALNLYYQTGFKNLFRTPLTCYDHILSEPLEKITLSLRLNY